MKNITPKLESKIRIAKYKSDAVGALPAKGLSKEKTSDQIMPIANRVSVITARTNEIGFRIAVLSFENGNTINATEKAVKTENVANKVLRASWRLSKPGEKTTPLPTPLNCSK